MAAALAVVSLSCTPPRSPEPASPPRKGTASAESSNRYAKELVAAIETSDAPRAFAALCGAYGAGGMACSETVYLTALSPTDVMSGIDQERQNVKVSPMPRFGGGMAYWDNWSRILAGGKWAFRPLFSDDDDARRTANMLLVTVMAHELGHHVAERFGCHPPGPLRELRADELSLAALGELLRVNRDLDALHSRMRVVADAMVDVVPAGARVEVPRQGDLRAWVSAQSALPSAVPAYVSLHLTRQRRVVAEASTFSALAQKTCLQPFASRVALRRERPSHTRTVASLHVPEDLVVAIDRTGHIFGAPLLLTPGDRTTALTIRRLDQNAPELEVTIPAGSMGVRSFAAFSSERFAISDGEVAWLVEHAADGQVSIRSQGAVAFDDELAFDEGGRLHVSRTSATDWSLVTPGGPPTWHLTLDTVSDATWADGSLADARARPGRVAIRSGEVVFFDRTRSALRSVSSEGVTTVAGLISGRHDGSSAEARFFDVVALAISDDGRIRLAEADHASGQIVVRVVERR
jgi:hypothetical protein